MLTSPSPLDTHSMLKAKYGEYLETDPLCLSIIREIRHTPRWRWLKRRKLQQALERALIAKGQADA
jgi:hypothetical protein